MYIFKPHSRTYMYIYVSMHQREPQLAICSNFKSDTKRDSNAKGVSVLVPDTTIRAHSFIAAPKKSHMYLWYTCLCAAFTCTCAPKSHLHIAFNFQLLLITPQHHHDPDINSSRHHDPTYTLETLPVRFILRERYSLNRYPQNRCCCA